MVAEPRINLYSAKKKAAVACGFGQLETWRGITGCCAGRDRCCGRCVFATVQLPLLGLGQTAVVLGHVSLFQLLQTGFALFEISGFVRV